MGEIDKPLNIDWEPDTQLIIRIICQEIEDMLLEKNRCYGDSAINPARIFSKSSPIEQINVRIDDKINRLMNGTEYGDEDTEKDLIGYLILKRVAERKADYESHAKEGKQHIDDTLKEFTDSFEKSNTDLGISACKLGTCGGEDTVLEDVGLTDSHTQCGDRVHRCNKERCVDSEDYEYGPTVQRNVFSDIVAKP
jgi:hypothetical protein